MSQDVERGEKYLAMIIGYDLPNRVILQLDNKFTAYIDISNYECSEKAIKGAFKINNFIDVTVTSIKKDMIICKPIKDIKIADDRKTKSDTGLTFNLKSLLDNIELK